MEKKKTNRRKRKAKPNHTQAVRWRHDTNSREKTLKRKKEEEEEELRESLAVALERAKEEKSDQSVQC